MLNLLKICTLVLSCIVTISQAMQPTAVATATTNRPAPIALAHNRKPGKELFHTIPSVLAAKPLVHINALMEQTDSFSCVYRTLFHALCITKALEAVAQGGCLEDHLKLLLRDESLLETTFNEMRDYLDKYHPQHDKSIGLCPNHPLGVCKEKIPLLHKKLLPILLEDNNKIYALHDPTPHRTSSPLNYSHNLIRHYGDDTFSYEDCRVELDGSKELSCHLKKLREKHQAAHFICRFPEPRHAFLASIITDKDGYAKLYVIDSNNNHLTTYKSIRVLTEKILSYVEIHNKKHARRIAKKLKAAKLASP